MADTATLVKTTDLSPYKRWETEITAAEKEGDKFRTRGKAAVKRYLDEREAVTASQTWFNIFYTNTNILESALYSQVPKPTVQRKYDDYKDAVGRVAALILERCLEEDLNDPADTFDGVMRGAVQDRLLPGLGTAWLRLETDTEDIPESEGGSLTNNTQSTNPGPKGDSDGFVALLSEGNAQPAQPPAVEEILPLKKITHQRVAVDYVYWEDFIWSPCRIWNERRWVGRKTYLDREQLEARFGEKGKLCSLDYNAKPSADNSADPENPQQQVIQKALVYEIWDRQKRKVIWFSRGSKELLDEKDDFLQLQSFEPCPTPMFANITTANTMPRSDYYMVQDQYRELDTVNARISLLVSACKVVGVYDQASGGLKNLLEGAENTMVPVENWGQFSEKGGTDGAVQWLPLDQIVLAMEKLYQAREAIKGQIYELTGIADIVRGASKASETLGAQQIKAQFASIRIKKLQNEVARFASDILRIKAEIMSKHFTPEMLIRKSGITFTDNGEYVAEAVGLLKSEEGFKWRVEVQADTLAQAEYDSEKQDRIEFMSAVTGYLAQAMPMATQVPELKPVLLGLLKWGMAGFKRTADIEGMIDKQLTLLEGKPPAPPPPDPAMIKAQADEKKSQLDMQSKQMDMQNDQKRMEMEQVQSQQELAMKKEMAQLEMQIKEAELRFKQIEHQQNLQFKMQENQMQMETQQQTNQLKVQDAMVQSDLKQRQGEQQLELSAAQGEQQLEQGEAAGEQKLKLNEKAAAQKAKQQPKKDTK